MEPFGVVFGVAFLVTTASTPLVARAARRIGAVDRPGDLRKVHRTAIPTLGGLAMLLGFLAAIGVAWLLAYRGWDLVMGGEELFGPIFATTSEPLGLLLGALVIAGIGVADDLLGLSPPVKLAGQILGALGPVLFGIQLVYAWIPGAGVVVLSPDLGIPLTVFVVVAMVNAVNIIDGLDGLAAGIVAIAAVAFFGFAYGAESAGIAEAAPTSATLVAAATAGIALGFLVHNFHPAKIFMGDTGSMLLGLLLASSGVAFVGRTTDPGYVDLIAPVPLVIPVLVIAIAFFDTAFAITRRLYRRQPISTADRGHLHHRLLRSGIGHRRTVLTLYYWSAVVAFAAVGVLYLPRLIVVVAVVGLGLVGAVATGAAFRTGRRDGRPRGSREAVGGGRRS